MAATQTNVTPNFYNPAANYLGLGLGAASLGSMLFEARQRQPVERVWAYYRGYFNNGDGLHENAWARG